MVSFFVLPKRNPFRNVVTDTQHQLTSLLMLAPSHSSLRTPFQRRATEDIENLGSSRAGNFSETTVNSKKGGEEEMENGRKERKGGKAISEKHCALYGLKRALGSEKAGQENHGFHQ